MSKWKYRESDDYFSYDKIRRGKDKRKKNKKAIDNFVLDEDKWLVKDNWFKARVVEVHKRYAFVSPITEDGDIVTKDVWLSTVARKHLQSKRLERNNVVVGDVVLCRPATGEEPDVSEELPYCVVENLKPRFSEISRVDPASMERKHILASNVDQLLIVASFCSPLVKWGLIDRYLVLAEEQNIEPIIVLNKQDLLLEESEKFQKKAEEEIANYRSLGYKVFSISVLGKSQDDIEAIGESLKDKCSILSGHSGVGKSSLVNLFRPEITQEVEANADIFYKGRHTTTYASLLKLGTGGIVVDTPGIRSFLLGERSSIDLTYSFREMRPYLGKCKYRECRHIDEPDCAILEALHDGKITSRRYQSYKGLLLGDTGRQGRTRDDELEE
ncbi:MAG: ribosome small subunit-dependent GTPase A [Pseudobacteriovorax sp.]|nr:ribosome small subunit-dependent GTPase A [Pseudobacteriovorax sp.]